MIEAVVMSIIFGSILALAALVCGTVLIINRTRKSSRSGFNSEEAETMQEIYRSLERMEQRVESLETILTENNNRKNK